MSALLDELMERAQALSEEERIKLSERLLRSVAAFSPGVEASWAAVVAERVAEWEAGGPSIPEEEVLAKWHKRPR